MPRSRATPRWRGERSEWWLLGGWKRKDSACTIAVNAAPFTPYSHYIHSRPSTVGYSLHRILPTVFIALSYCPTALSHAKVCVPTLSPSHANMTLTPAACISDLQIYTEVPWRLPGALYLALCAFEKRSVACGCWRLPISRDPERSPAYAPARAWLSPLSY